MEKAEKEKAKENQDKRLKAVAKMLDAVLEETDNSQEALIAFQGAASLYFNRQVALVFHDV